MTFIEKYMTNHPHVVRESIIAAKCPHYFGYEQKPSSSYCAATSCSECWNREIPGTEKKSDTVDIHKLIDDAMAKKDRVVTLYITDKSTSVKVTPLDSDEDKWIARCISHGGRYFDLVYNCPECGREAKNNTPYCPECGTQLKGIKWKGVKEKDSNNDQP